MSHPKLKYDTRKTKYHKTVYINLFLTNYYACNNVKIKKCTYTCTWNKHRQTHIKQMSWQCQKSWTVQLPWWYKFPHVRGWMKRHVEYYSRIKPFPKSQICNLNMGGINFRTYSLRCNLPRIPLITRTKISNQGRHVNIERAWKNNSPDPRNLCATNVILNPFTTSGHL